MGFDGDFVCILRDLVQFLECLREVKLPGSLETIRKNLLFRSKDTLTFIAIDRSTSPEPYLNMNGASKGSDSSQRDNELQEYVDAGGRPAAKHQDYYETFQEPEESPAADQARDAKENSADTLMDIYSSLPASQLGDKSHKCGPLYRKEGKKLFVFEQYRACWAGLVGSHLLLYGCERDNRPQTIQAMHGYMARPAPNSAPRDQRKSESAFEIFRPGSRTMQFIARTPKDMEQWVAKICEVGRSGKAQGERAKPMSSLQAKERKEELYQDVGPSKGSPGRARAARDADPASSGSKSSESLAVPALPARIPRRLPALPSAGRKFSREPAAGEQEGGEEEEEEEEDDIYHRIEDYKNAARYENVGRTEREPESGQTPLETYDDALPKTKKGVEPRRGEEPAEEEKTYDDIGALASREADPRFKKGGALREDARSVPVHEASNRAADKVDESAKSPQKKSLLDRVRSRRESPRKRENKAKHKTEPPPTAVCEEIPTYDDISGLTGRSDAPLFDVDLEYCSPPAPRPIYIKPPDPRNVPETEEFYDDVSAYRDHFQNKENKVLVDKPSIQSSTDITKGRFVPREIVKQSGVEDLHYQIPKSEAQRRSEAVAEAEAEELYDDIALLVDFTARQKEIIDRTAAEDPKSANNSDKKTGTWNRFVHAKKSRLIEPASGETNVGTCSNSDEIDEIKDHHGLIRMNTFQKFISKMESSLGKSPLKGAPPLPLSKTIGADDE
ncbi:hypothetical protein KM043_010482 [Ampulex compressa]|nr:hypothetical protein KM043_010482 [Ampulex compressa]